MEYVPEYLLEIWKSDFSKNLDLLFKIDSEIKEYTDETFLSCDKYADIIYKLKWQEEEEKTAFENANRNAGKMIPTLLRGVVVNNYTVEDSDIRCLQLADIDSFNGRDTTDAERLLFLEEMKDVSYTLFAYRFRKNFNYTIGELENIRPGTKVILSLIDFEPANNHPKRWITAYFTDVIVDNKPDILYVDKEYRIHTAKDYLTLYKSIRDRETAHSNKSRGGSSAQKRVSELDQRYAQYKAELERLAATEGNYDEIRQHYQEAASHHDAAKQRYDEFLAGLSSSADAQTRKASQNLAGEGKARLITGMIIAGAVFLFLFAPLGICLLAVGIVWAIVYTRNQKSSSLNLAQSHPEFQKIQQELNEAEQKMMYYKALTEKIKTIENYEKLHRIS